MLLHSESARDRFAAEFGGAGKLEAAAHGNYSDAYPLATESREALRASLGIASDAYVYLAFGQVRPYKGLVELIHDFSRVEAEDARLLVVLAADADRRPRRPTIAYGCDSRRCPRSRSPCMRSPTPRC